MINKCLFCGKPVKRSGRKYCDRECMSQHYSIIRKGICLNTGKTHFTSETRAFSGRKHSNKSNYKNRLKHLGKRNSKLTEFKKGQKPWNWEGGSSKERTLIAGSPEYRRWRSEVLWGGGWKCVQCGATQKLQADHILPWSKFPEHRYDLHNGQILCKGCHLHKTAKVDRLMPLIFNKIINYSLNPYDLS